MSCRCLQPSSGHCFAPAAAASFSTFWTRSPNFSTSISLRLITTLLPFHRPPHFSSSSLFSCFNHIRSSHGLCHSSQQLCPQGQPSGSCLQQPRCRLHRRSLLLGQGSGTDTLCLSPRAQWPQSEIPEHEQSLTVVADPQGALCRASPREDRAGQGPAQVSNPRRETLTTELTRTNTGIQGARFQGRRQGHP